MVNSPFARYANCPVSRTLAAIVAALCALCLAGAAHANDSANNIAARLVAESSAAPGETITLAVAMEPGAGWHGYWSNPGDAGFGMDFDWRLPRGASAGEPQFPVPQTLLIGPLMNHVYKGPFAILVPITVPADARPGTSLPIELSADWLACTDEICVPESAALHTEIAIRAPVAAKSIDPRFANWRAALPAPLAAKGRYAIEDGRMRIAVPLPRDAQLDDPHLFAGEDGLLVYAAPQRFSRTGDALLIDAAADADTASGPFAAVLRLGANQGGFSLTLEPGEVPVGGVPLGSGAVPGGDGGGSALVLLLLGAFAGGLLLNAMPCVFPILSLKALSLARIGGEGARSEALGYTAGVLVAMLALGAALLALRAAGQEIGWAFQLQEPATVLLLLLLAIAITANLAGVFEVSLPTGAGRAGSTPGSTPGSSFAIGALAAFVATPCTGPFMAAAMGAALLLPPVQALALFAALGLGLAAPFLLLGFVSALRRLLPAPGPWMARFRRVMAVPMGLTALALVWLAWRVGGDALALLAVAGGVLLLVLLRTIGRRQRRGRAAGLPALAAFAIALLAGTGAAAMTPRPVPSETILPGTSAFSTAALAEARAAGRPVFAYFTADWCVTCKLNERVAIDREKVHAAFAASEVVVLRGDWTRRDPALTRFLNANGAAGVPLYIWYAPGEPGEKLPQLLSADMLLSRITQPSKTF